MSDPFEKLRRQIEEQTRQPESVDLSEIDKCFAETFSTIPGKKALEYMRELWLDTQLFVPGDPHATAYKLGFADLVNYMNDCVKQRGDV